MHADILIRQALAPLQVHVLSSQAKYEFAKGEWALTARYLQEKDKKRRCI
jgi:hypothetical protein